MGKKAFPPHFTCSVNAIVRNVSKLARKSIIVAKRLSESQRTEILKGLVLLIQFSLFSLSHKNLPPKINSLSALPAVYLGVHMFNLEAVCAHRQSSSLKEMSLNLADRNFFQAVPRKPLIAKKRGETISPPLSLSHPNSPFSLLRTNRSKSFPNSFIGTPELCENRVFDSSEMHRQRPIEGHMTDSPESMSKILFEHGGPRGGGIEPGRAGSALD